MHAAVTQSFVHRVSIAIGIAVLPNTTGGEKELLRVFVEAWTNNKIVCCLFASWTSTSTSTWAPYVWVRTSLLLSGLVLSSPVMRRPDVLRAEISTTGLSANTTSTSTVCNDIDNDIDIDIDNNNNCNDRKRSKADKFSPKKL